MTEIFASAKQGVIRSPNSKKPKIVQVKPSLITEPSDSLDSEAYQQLHSISLRLPVEFEARQEAITAGQGKSGKLPLEKRGKGGQNRPALVARDCVLNSSQEEEKSETQSESSGSRRSTTRRKPVDKMGGVMIGSNTKNIQGAANQWKYPREDKN